jgi:hypothetical protein
MEVINGGNTGGLRQRTRIEKDAQNILKQEKVGLLVDVFYDFESLSSPI